MIDIIIFIIISVSTSCRMTIIITAPIVSLIEILTSTSSSTLSFPAAIAAT